MQFSRDFLGPLGLWDFGVSFKRSGFGTADVGVSGAGFKFRDFGFRALHMRVSTGGPIYIYIYIYIYI